jgi:nicotinamide riboside kinase
VRIASVILLLVVASLFAFWWGWVRAPTPPAVCEHIVTLMAKESAAEAIDVQTQARLIQATSEQCMTRAYDKLKLRGRLGYAKWAKCTAGAASVADSGRC